MQTTIAAIITTQKRNGQLRYVVRSLGTPRLSASDPLLKTAIQRLANEARKLLTRWSEKGDCQSIASWRYDPSVETKVFKQSLMLRDKTVNLKTILLIQSTGVVSTIAAPLLDGLLLQRSPEVSVQDQAVAGITEWCENLRKEDPELRFEDYSITGEIWIEPIDINLAIDGAKKRKKPKSIGAILGLSNPGGAESLQRVGRCLDLMGSVRCQLFGREQEAKRLESLLGSGRLQSVLLVGPASAGKSAILEEVVRLRVAERTSKNRHRNQVWLISPSRVISGMSYLGQWEERWLSILKEARKRDHVLYFDDPISLYSAGITRDSQLCMADVLRSFMAESPIRLVFETTLEGLSILRRRDRSLVDPMVPLRIDPLNGPETLRVLNEVMVQIESANKCFFHPGLMPEMVDHSNLLSPHLSLPGRVISIVLGLAADSKPTHAKRSIVRSELDLASDFNSDGDQSWDGIDESAEMGYAIAGNELDRFVQERTGLRIALRNQGLLLSDLRDQLSQWIVGQARAIEVLAEYAQRSLQRLQPVDKPLGVFLFLGPTGVGKTESAKALTRLLFQNDSRMIRIDMNEISSASAAESLIGTFDHPDGRLPSAIRRQPNAVLLLDEIEKAHPDALDYLLQVIGEGRLTDARGRPVDFRNAFIIMTSNLGSTESSQELGYEKTLSAASETQAAIYHRAAKRFFRPEFLNRIDELVIFNRLSREHMQFIVDHHLSSLKSRDGLSRRRVVLNVQPDAVSAIIDRGYDPALGARAIKRAIEREVAQPLADQLAAIRLESPVLIQLRNCGDRIRSETYELQVMPTETPKPEPSIVVLLESSRTELESLRLKLAERSPTSSQIDRRLDQVRYYAIHGAILEAMEYRRSVVDQLQAKKEVIQNPVSPIKTTSNQVLRRSHGQGDPHARLKNAALADLALKESLTNSKDGLRSEPTSPARELQRLIAMAKLMHDECDAPMTWLMRVRFLNPQGHENNYGISPHLAFHFMSRLEQALQAMQFSVQPVEKHHALVAEGVGVGSILKKIAGTYQHRLTEFADCVVLFEIKSLPNSDVDTCEQAIAAIAGGDGEMPNGEFCGFHGWKTIRGELGTQLIDFVSGGKIRFSPRSDSTGFSGWMLDQFIDSNQGGD